MKFDANHLTETSKEAIKKATEAAKGEDGGTCNLDAVFLVIPRAKEIQVISSLETGGFFRPYKRYWFGSAGYMLNPPACGQADSRVRACKTIYEAFISAGYEVYNFCMMG